MAEFKVYRFAEGTTGTMEVDTSAFGRRSPRRVQREAVLMYQANARAGTHDTLTRAEVNDSKRKPWNQKHTGRARAGFKGSPIWKGGGIIHGPHPRDYSYNVPRKALRAATRAALSGKLADGEVLFIDALAFERPATKRFAAMLKSLGLRGRTLLVLPERDENVWKSARNVPDVSVIPASDVNAYELLRHRNVLLTPRSLELLAERVGMRPAADDTAADEPHAVESSADESHTGEEE